MRSYQKILHLGDKMADKLLVGNVVIEEKVDGSMFRAQLNPDGTIECGSKRMDFASNGIDPNFKPGVDYLTEVYKKYPIDSTYTIFCEYLKSPAHNTLAYEKTPNNHLVLFDAVQHNMAGGRWLAIHELEIMAELLDIDMVPILYEGDGSIVNQDYINNLLTKKSYLGNELIEGIVVKNYDQYYDVVKYPYLQGFWLAGKYVRKEFQERNSGAHAGEKTGVEGLKISYGGPARWNKAIFRLRDEGKLKGNMTDMTVLLDEVKSDIISEEKENIKEELWKIYGRQILGSSIKGLPEYYKQKLLENL